jgi:ribosomal-protein-alanine N-acetyltransferase
MNHHFEDILVDTEIETPRLILRVPKKSDAEGVFNTWASSAKLAKYDVWLPHKSITETQRAVKFHMENWEKRCGFQYYVVEKDSKCLIGSLGLSVVDDIGVTIGWIIGDSYQGYGYASEGAMALVDSVMRANPGIEIFSLSHPKNISSLKVARRLGMKTEKVLSRYTVYPNISSCSQDVILSSFE